VWQQGGRTSRPDINALLSARLQPLRKCFSSCHTGPLTPPQVNKVRELLVLRPQGLNLFDAFLSAWSHFPLIKNSAKFGPEAHLQRRCDLPAVVSSLCRYRIFHSLRRHSLTLTAQKKQSSIPNGQASVRRAPAIKHQPRSKRYYIEVGLASVCLSGADTGGAYCLLDVSLAPGIGACPVTRIRVRTKPTTSPPESWR
jgi:hypothetical protein